ncbi:hypothetical protein [Pseudactinotalea sp. Z1732]|uniref:hypothetical protein n=1 Tax=Micrococcales TaxID=85006 RepID=UPI003C7C1594
MSGPADALVTPSDEPIIPDLAELVISSMGTILSPSGWIRTVVNWVFDWDPLAEVSKTFSGDWNSVAQAARAYENLASFSSEAGAHIGADTRKVQADWEGQAAEAAAGYMNDTLIPALTELAASLNNSAGDFRAVAVGMHRTSEAAISAFTAVTDWIIYTAAVAAAAAASSWTGVGAVIGGGATAAAVAKTIQTVSTAADALSAGQAVINVFAGVVPGYLGAIHGFRDTELPSGYNHALVTS